MLAAIDRSLGIDLNVVISNVKRGGSAKVCTHFNPSILFSEQDNYF